MQTHGSRSRRHLRPLNESPSEKEGKCHRRVVQRLGFGPSMKVPPKRKGNIPPCTGWSYAPALNESPSEKEGKCSVRRVNRRAMLPLNESPSEKEGKLMFSFCR